MYPFNVLQVCYRHVGDVHEDVELCLFFFFVFFLFVFFLFFFLQI